jgi:hypothetical protein
VESTVGLFSKFKDYQKGRDEKRISSNLATIRNSKAIKDDRVGAIDYFKSLDDVSVAVPALLKRFDYSLEHGINDTREKESCMEGIIAFKSEAIPFVREHLLYTSRIAWPIKILKALGEEKEVVEILKAALNFGDVSFDQAIVDKNFDILCYLYDYKVPNFEEKLSHFLSDPDERVRFACAELLIEQDSLKLPDILERFLSDETPDNIRIRKSVIDAYLKHGWKVKNPSVFVEGRVTNKVYVDSNGNLVLRK